MPKELTQREMASMGGKALAKKYGKRQRQTWGRRGGRPSALDRRALARLRKLLAQGRSQTESAREMGVSIRTIGRAVARLKDAGSI